MKWLNILIARLRGLLRREAILQDIEEEMRLHVGMEAQTNIGRGMKPDEAQAMALRSFGNLGMQCYCVRCPIGRPLRSSFHLPDRPARRRRR